MDEISKLDNIAQYNALRGVETLHPLVSVVDMSKANPTQSLKINFGFYCVFLKEVKCGDLNMDVTITIIKRERLCLLLRGKLLV